MSLLGILSINFDRETIAVKADRKERAGGYGWGII